MCEFIIDFESMTIEKLEKLLIDENEKMSLLELNKDLSEEFPETSKRYNEIEYCITKEHINFLSNLIKKRKEEERGK